ncbi:hypothetical protein [Ekhidna sp.]|uniref:hypothetical protein n=1 Tax=Ekhidna sp. TaxID=2608089 RepID=UPI003B504336
MKNTVIVFLVLFGIMSSCFQDDQLDELSIQDEISLIGMNEAILATIYYSDSLVFSISETNNPNDSLCIYYDSHYHHHDSLYSFHHNNYQLSNGSTTNQGCSGNNGNGMMGNGMGNNANMNQTNYMRHMNTEHAHNGKGHHLEDDYLMDSIRTAHQNYCRYD